jgi:group I intron endonuclease
MIPPLLDGGGIMKTGLYTITAPNGKFYVGSTSRSFQKRWYEHRSDLRAKKHRNPVLQAAWDKYGEDQMVFAVLQLCGPEECLVLEQLALDTLQHSYNIAACAAASFKGRRHTDSAKEKVRLAKAGKKREPFSEEHRAKLGVAGKGKKRPPFSDEHRHKMRLSQTGKTLSEDHRSAISAGLMGQKRPHSDAHRKAISIAKTGTKLGADNPVARSVLCVETGMLFPTVKAAGDWIVEQRGKVVSQGNISSCCTGKLKSAYGYHWRYGE